MSRSAADAAMDCVTCPRLCRDVCPVAVQSGRDDLVPSELMRSVAAAFGRPGLQVEPERLRACTACGACGERCLLAVPVPAWLAAARAVADVDLIGATDEPATLDSAPGQGPDADADAIADAVAVVATCGDPLPLDARAYGLDAAVRAPLRSTPRLPANPRDLPQWRVSAGASCCGARLDPRVGDPGLRERMAEAMIEELVRRASAGVAVVVADRACASWLQRVAGSRLRVLRG